LPKTFGYSFNFQKTAQGKKSTKRQKFAKSGHPDDNPSEEEGKEREREKSEREGERGRERERLMDDRDKAEVVFYDRFLSLEANISTQRRQRR
jgi:hypothetical protein